MSENNATPVVQGDPAQLGDAGKAALVAERKRADDAEKRVKELEAEVASVAGALDQAVADAAAVVADFESKVAALEAANGGLESQVMRLNVGLDSKLPRDLIDRLRGDDEAALRTDAESLKAFISDDKPSPFPKADPSQGVSGSASTTTADLFAAAVADHL